jgi:TonB family protein
LSVLAQEPRQPPSWLIFDVGKTMKYLSIILLSVISLRAADYSDGIKYAIEQLRASKPADGVPVLRGYDSNAGGVHGTFYLLWPYFFSRATRQDVALMLKDPSPLVRVLGARRVLEPFMRPLSLEAIAFLSEDTAEIRVGPLYEPKEHFETMTVASVIERMKKDPDFLFKPYWGEQVRLIGVMEAQPIRSVRAIDLPLPTYPSEMRRARISGKVTMRFVVAGDSAITDMQVIKSSQREFEPAAKDAISRWKFERTTGATKEPIPLECTFVFDFKEE